MRVKEKIGTHWIAILVDIGSTHNFLDLAIVKKAQISNNTQETVRVQVTNEELMESERKIKDLRVLVQGLTFTI